MPKAKPATEPATATPATPAATPNPRLVLAQKIADRLGRGRLVIEQILDDLEAWESVARLVEDGDFDGVALLLDGDAKAT
jgi:hypothetical protein